MFMYSYPRLKDLRDDADKTQRDIAKLIGVSQQHYGMYERGVRELPMHHFITLAKYYHVSLDYMVGLTNKKDSSQ